MGSRLLLLPLMAAVTFAAWPASAQLPRKPVTATAQPAAPGVPSFRDPKTGQVWTPDNVGESGKPVAPQDRAFDPSGQAVAVGKVYEQNAQVRIVGKVPITAGPTVPLVDIDDPTLTVQPGARWQVVLYLQNNSASTLAPSLDCRFTNGGNPVMASYVLIAPITGGDRVGLTFSGPPSDIYVDRASCSVLEP